MAAAALETEKLGTGGETVAVHLPPLSEEDPLGQDKKVRRERKKEALLFWLNQHIWLDEKSVDCTFLLVMWTMVKSRLIQVEELEEKTELAFFQETVKMSYLFMGVGLEFTC